MLSENYGMRHFPEVRHPGDGRAHKSVHIFHHLDKDAGGNTKNNAQWGAFCCNMELRKY